MPKYRTPQHGRSDWTEEIERALGAPASDSGRVYGDWLNATPTFTRYLDAAHVKLDIVEPRYLSWRAEWGKDGDETDDERFGRAKVIAGGWQQLGWTNRDVQNHLRACARGNFAEAAQSARGRFKRKDTSAITAHEAALWYHG